MRNSITIFRHAIRVTDKKYPTFAAAYYNLGNALTVLGRTKEAVYHLKVAKELGEKLEIR